jgi:uncharacterized protein YdhG (YjbR/CyaY superfamily)
VSDISITRIDDYILAQDPAIQERLWAVYNAISTAIPETEERISWQMPTFWKGRNIIHFAAGKKHIGIYPGPEAVKHFLPKLEEYKTSKGSIQLPNDKELPLNLIQEIAVWSYKRNRK